MAEKTGNIGFEETLWKAADKLRGSMDARRSRGQTPFGKFWKLAWKNFRTLHWGSFWT